MNEQKYPVVDLRFYHIAPRGMNEFLKHFNELAMPLLMKHLGQPVGFYTTTIGTLNQFVHIWEYESLADYERRSTARDSDPEFSTYLQATKGLVVSQHNQIIKKVAMNTKI
ncbi:MULTISPECIES: NIPSNAP family protein [Vitreoscilla]|uniref:NIPSNAP family protein n=1 Tax=Vitreoscilla stercoraria TaxID=61 RepID=A0ABY4ED13_VITST|nr:MULTISPECIES: NIPSNAP family protein [Vitreoscilla]AUZ05066.2 hypothetical protein ADP71_14680 [Vitreoscilla sp. C1]UOO93622.1 NIPSNAP family protein [Vitreoscilla stercoraria]